MGVAEGQGQGRRKQVRQASLRQNVQCPRQVQLQKKRVKAGRRICTSNSILSPSPYCYYFKLEVSERPYMRFAVHIKQDEGRWRLQ